MYVSTSRGHMLPTSTDDVFAPNIKSYTKSSQSPVTVSSNPHVCLTTSVHNNVIKKPITFRDSVIKRPGKCLRKKIAVNHVSKSVNKVVNCSRSFSSSSSAFVCQTFRFNRSVHKHISSSVINLLLLMLVKHYAQ